MDLANVCPMNTWYLVCVVRWKHCRRHAKDSNSLCYQEWSICQICAVPWWHRNQNNGWTRSLCSVSIWFWSMLLCAPHPMPSAPTMHFPALHLAPVTHITIKKTFTSKSSLTKRVLAWIAHKSRSKNWGNTNLAALATVVRYVDNWPLIHTGNGSIKKELFSFLPDTNLSRMTLQGYTLQLPATPSKQCLICN